MRSDTAFTPIRPRRYEPSLGATVNAPFGAPRSGHELAESSPGVRVPGDHRARHRRRFDARAQVVHRGWGGGGVGTGGYVRMRSLGRHSHLREARFLVREGDLLGKLQSGGVIDRERTIKRCAAWPGAWLDWRAGDARR